MTTRTGGFAIGFRRMGSPWQQDLPALARWAKEAGFEIIDLRRADADEIKTLRDAGLRIGSADLLDFGNLMATDPAKRKDLIRENVAYVKAAAELGAKILFACIIPGDRAKKRSENYASAVECFSPIIHAAREVGATIVIEGYPGGAPYLANLCCTPESCRAFIKDTGGTDGAGVGINYDPSHLIRLGVDHVRFLREFAPYVKHVHAKDTDLDSEMLYELGSLESISRPNHKFGALTWRYTIPGHGCTRWGEVLKILKDAGYQGAVSVELEDENFNGTEAGEKAGFLNSLAFLKGI